MVTHLNSYVLYVLSMCLKLLMSYRLLRFLQVDKELSSDLIFDIKLSVGCNVVRNFVNWIVSGSYRWYHC